MLLIYIITQQIHRCLINDDEFTINSLPSLSEMVTVITLKKNEKWKICWKRTETVISLLNRDSETYFQRFRELTRSESAAVDGWMFSLFKIQEQLNLTQKLTQGYSQYFFLTFPSNNIYYLRVPENIYSFYQGNLQLLYEQFSSLVTPLYSSHTQEQCVRLLLALRDLFWNTKSKIMSNFARCLPNGVSHSLVYDYFK